MHFEPIGYFAILLAVILVVPFCFEKLRLPGLLGLLAAGVVLGSNGLNVFQSESEVMKLLSDIGLVYLMFVAGLEIDMKQFQATKHRSIGFGSFTFALPLIAGIIVGRLFGFNWNASVLIGSLFASHTLLAYPIISRLGLVNNEAITVTIGATIFTDIGSLLVLAVCVGIHQGDFTVFSFAKLFLGLIIYTAIILFGFKWLGQEVFRRCVDDENSQFLFVLLVVFICAVGAEFIGVEKIVGAFLAGLSVNSVIGEGAVKEKVVFVGNALFIPIFFINLGLLINIPAFINSISSIWLTLAILIGLISSKFGAALLAKFVYRYSWLEMLTMWSLSLPQVAATLAATLVGYRAGILTEEVLNGVIVLMLVTATLGPIITARSAAGLVPVQNSGAIPNPLTKWNKDLSEQMTVVLPICNPDTERNLIELAALLVREEKGKILPLAITPAHIHMDAPELENDLQRNHKLLFQATEVGRELQVEVEPLTRIDDNIAQGISRTSREQNANLIIMGWGRTTGLRARLFGNIIDNVLWTAHCPVIVARLNHSPSNNERILVPIENFSQQIVQVMQFTSQLTEVSKAEVVLLHVCERRTSPNRIAWMRSQLELLASKYFVEKNASVSVIPADNLVNPILNAAKSSDLVILRAIRRRLNIGELAMSDVTTEVAQRLSCSVLVVAEPQYHYDRSAKPGVVFLDKRQK
ncbi:MAG: cation:proton antiporter [Scytonematopsis contorta HA4267-MV1]|jgi:Kef-type K+ transport system membrane component KefB/nucleotide-binding universal stress UspA family protein|nr:cation:proton antiporter [Scytonematopsis contorta HA4267-MV1]